MAERNGTLSDEERRRLAGLHANATAPPGLLGERDRGVSPSEGTMAKQSYRTDPAHEGLFTRAVANGDGTPITQFTDALVEELLVAVRTIRDRETFFPPRSPSWKPGLWESNIAQIPGIGAAVAYASGDAFGTIGVVEGLPPEGWISLVRFWDFDDEGLAKILMLFNTSGDIADIVLTGDNSAFDPSDSVLLHRGHAHLNIAASDFADFSANRFGTSHQPDVPFQAPDGRLAFGWITLGVDNIAATAMPAFQLVGTHYVLQ